MTQTPQAPIKISLTRKQWRIIALSSEHLLANRHHAREHHAEAPFEDLMEDGAPIPFPTDDEIEKAIEIARWAYADLSVLANPSQQEMAESRRIWRIFLAALTYMQANLDDLREMHHEDRLFDLINAGEARFPSIAETEFASSRIEKGIETWMKGHSHPAGAATAPAGSVRTRN